MSELLLTNEILSDIPSNVYSQICITNGASERFLNLVAQLEDPDTDAKEAASIASEALDEEHIESIDYELLRVSLKHYQSADYKLLRSAYLIEKSIPRRDGFSRFTWVDRLKVFADTYVLETYLNKKKLAGLPGKIMFTRDSGDHLSLHKGAGQYKPDFYCWDASGNKFHAFVEFKHWGTPDVKRAMEYYSDKRYSARYVVVFTSDHKFYLIDYAQSGEPRITLQDDLKAPDDLLIW